MAKSVTVVASTISGTAATPGVIVLDPVAKSTTVMLTNTVGTSCTALVQVEYSLDDPTLVPLGGPATTWALLSSATAMQSSNTNGLSWTVLSPIGQVRINSTSGSTGVLPTFVLKALQAVTA